MKLPDSEPLANYEYLIVTDQWKQEWEKGVQVPVNPDSLPEPCVYVLSEPIVSPAHDFKLWVAFTENLNCMRFLKNCV